MVCKPARRAATGDAATGGNRDMLRYGHRDPSFVKSKRPREEAPRRGPAKRPREEAPRRGPAKRPREEAPRSSPLPYHERRRKAKSFFRSGSHPRGAGGWPSPRCRRTVQAGALVVAGSQWSVAGRRCPYGVQGAQFRAPGRNRRPATGHWPQCARCAIPGTTRTSARYAPTCADRTRRRAAPGRGPGYSFGAVRSMRVSRATP